MGRLVAPLLGVLGFVVLVAGLTWAEVDSATMAGVGLVGVGVLALLLATAVVAVHEGAVALRRRRG